VRWEIAGVFLLANVGIYLFENINGLKEIIIATLIS